MGAGDFLAGDLDLAGEDPVAAASAPRNVTPPRALLFDGATRSFTFDALGRLNDIHPVDQKVALALIVELGKITAAPDVGVGLRKIKYIDSPRLDTQVNDALQAAVGQMIKDGDIRQIAVNITRPNRHAFGVQYQYANLRAQGRPLRTITVQ